MSRFSPMNILPILLKCGAGIILFGSVLPRATAPPAHRARNRPTITHLVPDNYTAYVPAGGPNSPLKLDVRGMWFKSGATVKLGSRTITTTFVSSTELKAQCSYSVLLSIKPARWIPNKPSHHGGIDGKSILHVTVRNPGKSDLTSKAADFTIELVVMDG